MPRRRSGTRALKTWTSALRAVLRLAGSAAAAGRALGATTRPGLAKKVKKAAKVKGSARRLRPAGAKAGGVKRPARKTDFSSAALLPGQVEAGRFRNLYGTRPYRLYRPLTPAAPGTRAPLLVLLHGCGQDAEGFAAATRMPQHAQASGCWVLCPEQPARVQRNRCWNWFEPSHQRRGSGEPAILAGMAKKVLRQHGLDARRVFVAGLSAGGAMAVILGRTYPDVFHCVGVCAGMPYAAARTGATALMAMRGRHRLALDAVEAAGLPARPVRTIVFHGGRDRIIVPANADAIVTQALQAFGPVTAEHEQGTAGGRSVERDRYRSAEGEIVVERWSVAGAGHAWSGGAAGAFSDPTGPDASALLLQFFLAPDA